MPATMIKHPLLAIALLLAGPTATIAGGPAAPGSSPSSLAELAQQAEFVAKGEWLAGEEAQATFAALNLEFPANPAVQPDPTVAAWGTFKGSPLNVALYGKLPRARRRHL